MIAQMVPPPLTALPKKEEASQATQAVEGRKRRKRSQAVASDASDRKTIRRIEFRMRILLFSFSFGFYRAELGSTPFLDPFRGKSPILVS